MRGPARERVAAMASAPGRAVGPAAQTPRKERAAAVSIVSNTILIALKLVAGVVTGSIAIITEAVHSSIDLVASIIAFFSVRKAGKPADDSHPYGHDKVENVAAAIEGMLILVGAGVIIFESLRRLAQGSEVESLGFGIAVVGFSAVANFGVSAYLYRQARATESPALEGDAAHLRTDAFTSLGVLLGLVLVELTGASWLDPLAALIVAGAIVFAGVRILNRTSRVLVDEALPPHELSAVREAIDEHGAPELAGFHKLRARRAGSRRYIDMHVQFREGTSLRRAHEISHELQRAIAGRLRGADVLVHLEPEVPADRPPRAGLRTD
jgi:cation diffusion facilitator family transporter